MSNICTIFRLLAVKTWTDLEDAQAPTAMSIGEESVTDFLLLDLKRALPTEVKIRKFTKPQEATTGADWEWWFLGATHGFGMRVQAKILNPFSLRYEHLWRKVRASNTLQINLLLNDAKNANLYALYCFYNYWKTTATPSPLWYCGSFPFNLRNYGCTIADANSIKKSFHQNHKDHLNDISTLSLPWECLVCCKGLHAASLPEGAREVALLVSGMTRNKQRQIPDLVLADQLPQYVRVLANASENERPELDIPKERRIDGVMIVQMKK